MAQYGRPTSDISVGSWGTSPLWDKVDDVTPDDATTQIQTGANPSNQTAEVKFSAVTDPVSSNGHIARVRAYTTKSCTLAWSIYQGATLIANCGTITLAGSYTDYSYTLSTAQADAITDYSDLRVRFTGNGSGRARVTKFELEVPDPIIQKSGSGSISGPTHVLATIVKTAIVAAAFGILGHAYAAGFKAYPVIVHGGGTLEVLASKWSYPTEPVPVSGGGTAGAQGEKAAHSRGFYDEFHGESGALSNAWLTINGYPSPQISNGKVKGSGAGTHLAKWQGEGEPQGQSTWPRDPQFSEIAFNGTFGVGPAVRLSNPFAPVQGFGYVYRVDSATTIQRISIQYGGVYDEGTLDLSGNPLVPGDVLRIEVYTVEGTPNRQWTILYRNGSEVERVQRSVGVAGGGPGIYILGELGEIDRWGGGWPSDFSEARISGSGNIFIWSEDHYGSLAIHGGGPVTTAGKKGAVVPSSDVVPLYVDDFDRADEQPIQPPWDEIAGDVRILSNKLNAQPGSLAFYQNPLASNKYTIIFWMSTHAAFPPHSGISLKSELGAGEDEYFLGGARYVDEPSTLFLIRFFRNGVEKSLTLNLPISAAPTQVPMKLVRDGANFAWYYAYDSGSSWVFVNSWNDPSPMSTPYAGVRADDGPVESDMFSVYFLPEVKISSGGAITLQGQKGGLYSLSPIVIAQDDFNRGDTGTGNLGSNWYAGLARISGQKVVTGYNSDNMSYWTGAGALGDDQISEITWPDVSSGDAVKSGPAVRMQGAGGGTRYCFIGSLSGLKSYAGIYAFTPAMYIVGGYLDTSWIPAGAKIRLSVTGNVLDLYVNGVLWVTRTDTNNRIPSGGVAGFYIGASAAVIDNFIAYGPAPVFTVVGGGRVNATGRKVVSTDIVVHGGGTIYASAREEAYRAVALSGGGGIVPGSHKGARSGVPIPGAGTVSVQTRKDALVVVRVSGNGINTGDAIANARGLVWALLRGGGDIAVTFLAEHPGSPAVTGGGSIVVKWVRSWPHRPVTDIGDSDATALLVEIDLEVCTREFGISPCLGSGAPCYKTWGTCKYISAFAPTKQTYRFCSADYPQIFPDARPYLIDVKWLATEIKQNLTVNARVVLDFIDEPDTDVGFDPYWSQRENHPGTFWKKFFARNINYRGRFVRVYEGRPGAAESTYVLRWPGRLDNVTASGSQFQIESVDILKDISKIEVPPKVSAKLAADTAAGYTVSFSITADADKFPSSGYVRIEDEIIKYESKDDLTKVFSLLSRGQFGTVDSNHPASEKVQPVRYFAPKSGYDHLLDMLLVDGAIDPVYVDSPAFFFYRDFPQKDIDFTAVVSEPTRLSTLFYEVLDLLDSKAWVSENFKITVRRNVQNQPGRQYYPLDDETSLIDKTVKVDLNEDSRITRVAIFWDLKVVSKSTDQTSYRKIDLAVNPDAETNYDGPIEKKILCRWIDPTIVEEEKVMRYVRNLALRRIVRERDAQTIIHIEVAPKDAGVLTGEFIFMTSNETLAVDGEPLSAIYQVVKRERKKDSYALTLSKVARRRICLIAPSGFPSYASATDAQREYGFVSDIQGKMSDFRYGYFIW